MFSNYSWEKVTMANCLAIIAKYPVKRLFMGFCERRGAIEFFLYYRKIPVIQETRREDFSAAVECSVFSVGHRGEKGRGRIRGMLLRHYCR